MKNYNSTVFKMGNYREQVTWDSKILFDETLMEADLKIKRGKKFQTRDLKVPF